MQVIAEGANAIVAGSAVFKAKDYAGGKTDFVLSTDVLSLTWPASFGIRRFTYVSRVAVFEFC